LVAQSFGKENLTGLVKKIHPAIVTVKTYNSNNRNISIGSGFFLNKKGHLITNRHVLLNAYNSEVVTFDGEHYPILRVLDVNEQSDLIKVVVDIPKSKIKWLKVTKNLPAPAEHIIVIGSPKGLSQTISDGIVSFVPEETACEMPLSVGNSIQITAPISQGSSGSPVVNMEGEVIGVATFIFAEGQNLNFAAPGKCVLDLSEEKINRPLSEWASDTKKEILIQAEHLYKTENYEMAIEVYNEIIRSNPYFAEAHYGLGRTYKKFLIRTYVIHSIDINKNPLAYQAIGAFKEAIRINSDYAEAYCELGDTLVLFMNIPEAISYFKKAIDLQPDYADAHEGLGVAYAHAGYKNEALKQFRILKNLDESKAWAVKFVIDWFDRPKESQKTDDENIKIYKDKKGTIVITDH